MLGIPREWPEVFDALLELHEAEAEREREAAEDAERQRKRALLAGAARRTFGR